MIGHYDWAGGREAMMRFGPAHGPVVILALPPFEEANRTRTFAAGILRALGARGIVGLLPDLPGAGDSLIATQDATLANWRAAFAAAAVDADHVLAIRAGALIDGDAVVKSRWLFAPQEGASLVRELVRVAQAAAREDGTAFDPQSIVVDGPPIAIAGNALSRAMLRDLGGADHHARGPVRTVRLESDAAAADRKFPGAPLWRRAEPGDDPALAALLADDIADWIAQCGE